jgi:hypothetical protein
MKRLALLAALAALAGCSRSRSDAAAPWLTMPDLATHTALYFPIDAGAVHGPAAGQPLTTCDQCHLDRSTGKPAADFRTFTCTGCHVQIRPGVYHDDPVALASVTGHPGLAGFDPTLATTAFDRSCRTCHPIGIAVDHAKVFPLPHQNATGTLVAACADCHVSTDRTVLGCAACHANDQPAPATAHALVPDFVDGISTTASAFCARCHGDDTIPVRIASVDPKLAHTAFPIEKTGLHVGASGGACLSCHPSFRTDPHKTFAADFTVVTCTGCHVSTAAVVGGVKVFHDDATGLASFHTAQLVTGFVFDTPHCLNCHPDGSGGAPSYHGQLFPVDAASKHAGIACSDCHSPSPAPRSDITNMQCASCHADPTKSPSFPTVHDPAGSTTTVLAFLTPPPVSCTPVAFTPTSADCLSCHAQSHVDLFSAHPTSETSLGRSEHKRAGCLTCHVVTTHVSAAVTPAPAGYDAIDFLTFVSTITGTPVSPSRGAKGCFTCHGYSCGNGN